jgi:hypothetical protein
LHQSSENPGFKLCFHKMQLVPLQGAYLAHHLPRCALADGWDVEWRSSPGKSPGKSQSQVSVATGQSLPRERTYRNFISPGSQRKLGSPGKVLDHLRERPEDGGRTPTVYNAGDAWTKMEHDVEEQQQQE